MTTATTSKSTFEFNYSLDTLEITVDEVTFRVTAQDSVGRGRIARWFDAYALSDEEILKLAFQFPNNLEVTTVK